MVNAMDLSDAVIVNTSRLKSVVWNDFDRLKKGETYVAICRHCKKRLSGSSTSGTSHLRNHLIRCQRNSNPASDDIIQYFSPRDKKREQPLALMNSSYNQEQKKDEGLGLVNIKFEQDQMKEDSVNPMVSTFDQRRSQFDLARMIILHGYPLTMVEHVGFKVFVKNLQPLFELVTYDKVEADCLEIHEKEKQKVFEVLDKLPGKISISTDLWASSDDIQYFCLKAHFIDEAWLLKKKILSLLMVDSSHTEDMQADAIMSCLMDWDIDRKLFCMTVEGCSSNNIISRTKDRLSQNRFLSGDGQLFDVRCAASVINLMVQEAMESLLEVNHKIRESIRYIKSSQAAEERFNGMVQKLSMDTQKCLLPDNKLGWDSTYRMLEVALEYKGVFLLLREDDPLFACPDDEEWEKVGALVCILNVFVEIILDFTRSKYSTANIYFPLICDLHLKFIGWSKSSDNYISSLAMKLRQKFDDYWERCSLGLAIAVFLDPRFKMKLVEYYFPQIYGSEAQAHINGVLNGIKTLYNEDSVGSLLSSSPVCPVNGNETKDRLVGFDKYLHETSQNEAVKSDLVKYLEEPLFPRNADFDVLNWWKVHAPRYPILSMMVRNVLAIPMSNVQSETAFHTCGRMLDRNHTSLGPSTLQALMCSQDWIKSELES